MRPSVTVAIPTRNRAALFRDATRSALAAMGPSDELVVSDNASSDDTQAAIAAIGDPRVVAIRQASDLGMVGNWNACLRAATKECFILLSDDDLMAPGGIDALIAPLADAGVAFAYGRARVIDAAGAERTLGHLGPAEERGESLVQAWFRSERTLYPCAVAFRRADLLAVGGYDARFGPFADVGAWLATWAARPERTVRFVADVVASYRDHEQALSTTALAPGLAGIAALTARFAAACGPGGVAGFARLRAHFVASALRRRARATALPAVAYLGLLATHLPEIVAAGSWEPYWRQFGILANPAAHERRKRLAAERRQNGP